MGRSFTMQIPFLLIAYFLFLINNKKIYGKRIGFRYAVSFLTFLFIFYLSFLHFFRYPYSRYKKYIVPLVVERAKGIKVTYPEKELYETLDRFLSKNSKTDEVIGILGNCPTLSFISQRQNIFDGETISLKLSYLSKMAKSSLIYQERLKELEDYLINKLELKKPKFILEPIIFSNEYPRTRLNKYIDKVYVLDKTLGPAELDIYTPGIVKIYRLKE